MIDGKVYYCMRSDGVNEFDLVRRGCLHLWETPKRVISLQGICFGIVVRGGNSLNTWLEICIEN